MTTRSGLALLVASGLLVVVALGGCGAFPRAPEPGRVPLAVGRTDTTPPLLVHNYDDQRHPGLLVIGRVRYLAEPGCFVVEDEDGYAEPVVWPLGTAPTGPGGTLVGLDVPGFGLVRLDAEIRGRGLNTPRSDGWAEVPAECYPADRTPGDLPGYLLVYSVSEVG